MDKKVLIKNILIAVFVPIAITASYFGIKYSIKKWKQYKDKRNEQAG